MLSRNPAERILAAVLVCGILALGLVVPSARAEEMSRTTLSVTPVLLDGDVDLLPPDEFQVGSQATASAGWWHSISQGARDATIRTTGIESLHTYGGQCKVWIQRVVHAASQSNVWPPLNMPPPNDYQWRPDASGNTSGACQLLEHVPLGRIIQMKLSNGGPHTAIVYTKTATDVTFLDSNWQLDGIVRTHTMTYAQFYAMLYTPGSYTVYTIF